MTFINEFNGENIRVKLTFDNGQTYIAETLNRNDKEVYQLEINENEGNTNATPIGIMSPNTASIQLLDNNNQLVSVNKQSPYYGYMRDGVRVDIYREKSLDDWESFGVYYTDGWNSAIEYGEGFRTSLYCYDRLNWLGNKEIPKIPAFTSIKIGVLLEQLLLGCGLTADEFEISNQLDLDIAYSVTKGSLMRDTLNEIAQALLARITCNRFGKIIIKPAFSDGKNIGTLKDVNIQNFNIKHNTNTMYKHVKLNYNKIDLDVSQVLAQLKGVQLAVGENVIPNIDIGSNCQGIDAVNVNHNSNEMSPIRVTSIHYTGFQNGLTVGIMANTSTKADIVIEGRRSSNTTAVEYSIGADEDTSKSNVLQISNIYIQDETKAKKYVADVKEYLDKIAQQYTIITPAAGLDVECGKYFNLPSESMYGGTFYIKGVRFTIGTNYRCTIDAIKVA